MAVNKNFVVKNGLEVNTDLILADAARNKVGIGSTTPRTELDVRGGIAATDISVSGVGTIVTLQSTTGTITDLGGTNLNYSGIGTIGTVLASSANVSGITTTASLNVSGIATIAVGIVTNLEGTNLNYSGIATANSISIGATQVISNERQLQNIVSLDATTTATIESAIANAPNTFTDLNVTGISTLGTVLVSSGVITATSGIVTYYGDGAYLQNISAGVGIGTSIGLVGYGATFINFFGSGVSTAYYSSTTGIATIYFEGGGGGSASIGIGSTPGDAFTGIITAGNLWYNTDIGRLFIYYQDTDSAQWVDAAPFNIGVLNPVSIALTSGTVSAPSLYFSGDTSTGLFQPTPGQQTLVSSGAAILNVNPGGVNVTGVVTATSAIVGVGVTINNGGINVTGVVTATSFRGDGSNLTNLPAGLGTALSSDQTNPLNKIYYTDQVLSIGSTVTVDPPSTAKVAYTQYAEILVDSGADLIIADGDDFIPNILGIGTTGTLPALGGSGGRVRADNFANNAGTGAPTFTAGLNVTGVVTATTFDGTATTATTANALATNATGTNLILSGDLTVNGTQTVINTQILDVADKTVGVASTSTKTALTQDGGGLVIYGPSDINFTYDRNKIAVGLNTNLSVSGVVTATSFRGDGSQLTGLAIGIGTEQASPNNTITFLDLSKQDHKLTVSGITTISVTGGTEGESHTVRIINSGIATVGFSTYFLFPSGSPPSLSTADGTINLISFTVHRVGAAGTQLLAGASVNFS